MNLKLKKLTIATAAAVAMGTAGQAQSADVLFPYVVVSESVTTIINVINTGEADELHYRLWYKNGPNATDNLAACEEYDVMLPSSPKDIQTIDIGARLDQVKGVMFNDPSVNNNWMASTNSYALADGATLPLRGYVVIDNQTIADPQEEDQTAAALAGEAFVFEYQSGAAWGYRAGNGWSTPDEAADFRMPMNGVAFNEGTNAGFGNRAMSVLPFNEATTRLFVTPLVDDMRSGNNTFGGAPALVRTTMGEFGQTAMYDRDENPISGNRWQYVRCVGAFDVQDMLTELSANRLVDGGWGWLNSEARVGSVASNSASSHGMSVIKLEFNDGTSSFAGASAGVFNNAFLLRSRGFPGEPLGVR
ncbi:hypothetical protein [Thioalkalivibrio paradoxus]|uniref:Uncharacterized protein n=1 Tax=Thioalkalivibrio paradoxus ARh 1 TaxID=713585 RepID=W0DTC7_9GAMM|nr:hypothetical protein [Thioalkalivibrio paradoxus]AHF00136.1 hypothetical protein THITH_10155 [Thioalkalivibrio paradoxus ARh 1]